MHGHTNTFRCAVELPIKEQSKTSNVTVFEGTMAKATLAPLPPALPSDPTCVCRHVGFAGVGVGGELPLVDCAFEGFFCCVRS